MLKFSGLGVYHRLTFFVGNRTLPRATNLQDFQLLHLGRERGEVFLVVFFFFFFDSHMF